MDGLKHIAKIREYCDYIEEHLKNVSEAWREIQEKCTDMRVVWDDFYYNSTGTFIVQHDLSKFSPEEFIQYQRNFFPVGEKDDSVFDESWKHHIENNPHHWENWTQSIYQKKNGCGFIHDWECHCVCMVCDWMAMGKKFGDTAQSYYEANKHKIDLPDHAVSFIYEIFDRIK